MAIQKNEYGYLSSDMQHEENMKEMLSVHIICTNNTETRWKVL